MRRLVFASVLLLAACGDKQEVSQNSGGAFSPNQVAGRDAIQNVNVQNATINMSPEMLEKLAQVLKAQGVPADQLNAQLEEFKRKYADLEQRLGEYAKTDELAQQARKELDLGNLDQAETLLQQAYDKDYQLSRQRLAKRAFDLAEVAELRLDHDKALARYREVTQLQPDNLQAWKALAEIAEKTGDTALLLEAAQKRAEYADITINPYDHVWGTIKVGDGFAALGENIKALEQYQKAHKLLQQQADKEPNNTQWQRDLSVSYGRLGNMYKVNGDMPAALKAYQDSLSIRNKLVELDPKQAEWQRDLSVSYEKLGNTYKANGDTPAALKAYQDSLSIRNKLVELDPKQAEWQRDLSVSYNKVGDLYKANGDTPAALKAYQDSLSIAQKLVELDPNVVEWQTDVVASYYRMAEMQPAKANEFMHKSLDVLQKLHDSKRLPKDWEQWLEITKGRLK